MGKIVWFCKKCKIRSSVSKEGKENLIAVANKILSSHREIAFDCPCMPRVLNSRMPKKDLKEARSFDEVA
jgi:hypothetical protein